MNGNNDMDNLDVVVDDNVSVANETDVTETEITETEQTETETEEVPEETETELTDTEQGEDVSATDSLTVADTPAVVECQFDDTNILAKMDIIIMLLIVMIALKMFSPLANNHKRGLEKKER